MKECGKDREEDRADRAALRADIKEGFRETKASLKETHDRIDEVHGRINDDRAGTRNMWFGLAGTAIIVLLSTAAYLFTKSMGWH